MSTSEDQHADAAVWAERCAPERLFLAVERVAFPEDAFEKLEDLLAIN